LTVIKRKSRETLILGEHVDWIWINQTWGGVKIGPNRPTFYGNTDNLNFSPIYLNVAPTKFQFKGDFRQNKLIIKKLVRLKSKLDDIRLKKEIDDILDMLETAF
jgi:hypothetical protein